MKVQTAISVVLCIVLLFAADSEAGRRRRRRRTTTTIPTSSTTTTSTTTTSTTSTSTTSTSTTSTTLSSTTTTTTSTTSTSTTSTTTSTESTTSSTTTTTTATTTSSTTTTSTTTTASSSTTTTTTTATSTTSTTTTEEATTRRRRRRRRRRRTTTQAPVETTTSSTTTSSSSSPTTSASTSTSTTAEAETLATDLVLFGSSLYRYESDRMRYDDAETECNALGEGFGLAKVESQAEQDFVWELAGSPANNPVWISLRRFSEGFRYGDGSALSFEFWATGEPNNLKDSEDCGRLGHKFTSLGADGSWFDTSCTMRSSFVCEGPAPVAESSTSSSSTSTSGTTSASTSTSTDKTTTSTTSEPGDVTTVAVPEGFSVFRGNFYRHFVARVNFNDARAVCNSVGAELTSISSEAENTFVHSLEGGERTRWIGLVRSGDTFAWLDGTPFTYSNWFEGEPNNFRNREDCVTLGNTQFAVLDGWNDADCNNDARGFVCKISGSGDTTAAVTSSSSTTEATTTAATTSDSTSSTTTAASTTSSEPTTTIKTTSTSSTDPTSTAVPTTDASSTSGSPWSSFGASEYLYMADDLLPQAKARKSCEDLGATLVSINSEAEGVFVSQLEPLGRPRWLGIKRDSNDEFTEWEDGTAVIYTNFYADQPDNLDGREKCVLMSKSSEPDVTGWDDRMCVLQRSYVCERAL